MNDKENRAAEGSFAFYSQRADDCLLAATKTTDLVARDEWLRLANQWTHLALHANRRLAERAATKRETG